MFPQQTPLAPRFKKLLALLCLILLTASTNGCKKWVTVSMSNHYGFPIDIFDARSSPSYPMQPFDLAPNAVSTFQIQAVPDGGMYYFVLHNQQRNVRKNIVISSTALNASINREHKPLVLAPDPKARTMP